MGHVPQPRNKIDSTPRQPSDLLTEPLLIRTIENCGLLPKGFVFEIPRFEAERLIMRRKAIAVGTINTLPDLTLTEDDCIEAVIGY
jgi:hypothetical protein